MRITGYRVLATRMDWGRRIGDANGVQAGHLTPADILVVETDTGLEGIATGATGDLGVVFPAVDGRDPRAVSAAYDAMLARCFKAGSAGAVFGTIGTLDLALWDLKAKAAGEPLWRLLGAADRAVPAYASGLDAGLDDDELARFHRGFAERGFTAAKLKGGRDPEADLRRLDVVRDALGVARPTLALDANEVWNPTQAVRYLHEIERRIDLAWIEEPVRRWDARGLARVGRATRCAVASGENLTGLEQFRPLLLEGALDIVQTAGGWGLTHFLRVAAFAHAMDLPVSPVGTFHQLAPAAAAVPNHLLTEVQSLALPAGLSGDWTVEDGHVLLGREPGNGLSLDPAAVEPSEVAGPWAPHVRDRRAGLSAALRTAHPTEDADPRPSAPER